jgi:flagellar biosynthesis protein FlhF
MSEVRTFRAASMQEALQVVRQEMGAEAVILHTRQTLHRRLLPWQKPTVEVEITAGLGVNIRPAVSRQPASEAPLVPPSRPIAARSTGAPPIRQKTTSVARVPAAPPVPQPRTSKRTVAETQLAQGATVDARKAAADPSAVLGTQLHSIQRMVENLNRTRQRHEAADIPGDLFYLYTELIDADVEDALARELVARLRRSCPPEQLAKGDAAKALLTAMVESEIRCSGPILPPRGTRKVVALVGPTGVGKTTTIAKLAANFRLRDGCKMGLVTVDTYRVAAVEQLRTYAEIIDLPMKVVTSPLEMRRALEELAGLDLVLIDTAGRSPRDEMKIQELKTLLAEADVDEVHLVLSLTSSLKSIEATAEKFRPASITSLVLTKLDEAPGMGSLLSVAQRVPFPISYLTTGQDVPDDIEPANACRISRLVLGQDKLAD